MPVRLYALAILLAIAGRPSPAAESLFVFFPTTVRPHVLQKGLAGSGLDVTAFGRFADFEDGVKSKPPDAILSLPEVIGNLEGYKVSVLGKRNGEAREPYFLLGVDKAVEPSALAGGTLGIVDFLGRKGMQKFVAGIFQPPPALKTVAKVEDLLPLLTFKMADGLLVTRAQADYFRSVSQLNFVVTPVPNARTGMICLAVRKGADAPKAVQAVKGMDADLRKLLGEVQWD
jgi:hypothetical protein